jgi:DNA-binding MarR family transcriptional regulator
MSQQDHSALEAWVRALAKRLKTKYLTTMNLRVLLAIQWDNDQGRAPATFDELGWRCGVRGKTVLQKIIRLENLGLIDREPNLSRAIRLRCRFERIAD